MQVKNWPGWEWTLATWNIHKSKASHRKRSIIITGFYTLFDPKKKSSKQKQVLAQASKNQMGVTQFISIVKSTKT
jgi:hypothetical protein